MYLEYIVGPVIGLLLGMKYTKMTTEAQAAAIKKLESQVTQLETNIKTTETELPQKMLALQVPVAKAIKAINEQIGLQ